MHKSKLTTYHADLQAILTEGVTFDIHDIKANLLEIRRHVGFTKNLSASAFTALGDAFEAISEAEEHMSRVWREGEGHDELSSK